MMSDLKGFTPDYEPEMEADDHAPSAGGSQLMEKLVTKEQYRENPDLFKALNIKALRTEFVRLGGESSVVEKLPKYRVLKLMTTLVTSDSPMDAADVSAAEFAEISSVVSKRIDDPRWLNEALGNLPYSPIMLALVGDPTAPDSGYNGELEERKATWRKTLQEAMMIMEDTLTFFPDMDDIDMTDPSVGIGGYEQALGVMEIAPSSVALPRRNTYGVINQLKIQIRIYNKKLAAVEMDRIGIGRSGTKGRGVDDSSMRQLEEINKLANANTKLMEHVPLFSSAKTEAKLTEAEAEALKPRPGIATAAMFKADTEAGARMRAALFKQTDPQHSTTQAAVKSGVLQNLLSDASVWLSENYSSLRVPVRQIRYFIIGVFDRQDGADIASWQTPIDDSYGMHLAPISNPDEVLIGKTNEGRTVVSESARKSDSKFPKLTTSEQLAQCLAVQSRVLALFSTKYAVDDFREFANYITALSQEMDFQGVFFIYNQIAATYTTVRRAFMLGRLDIRKEPEWMRVTEQPHIKHHLLNMRQRWSKHAVAERQVFVVRIARLEADVKTKSAVWARLEKTATSKGKAKAVDQEANKSPPGAAGWAAAKKRLLQQDEEEAERHPKKVKKKTPGAGASGGSGGNAERTTISLPAFRKRCKELSDSPPFPCFDHHTKADGCRKGDECAFTHEGEANSLPEGY